jgi:hypothetical protein
LRLTLLGAAVVVLAAATGVSARLHWVADQYGVDAITPGRQTPRLPYAGRVYVRSGEVTQIPPGSVKLGTAPGDGAIYGYESDSLVPTVIVVGYPDGQLRQYVLSGGP